ncbi:hypothetical protein [Cupriavidus campinensis]|uniref:hypothetical protein n=1 Tax=Cupriavidus campinensis TaxID=151783 RepID=UPI0024E256CD|nr:hypothetical protein [Cupriavidus campinensis]
MKSWRLVGGLLGGIAAVLIISVFGATSAGTRSYDPSLMASWVQAVGSVAAILGSIYVGRAQGEESLRQAKLIRELDLRRRHDLIRAVLLGGYVCCANLRMNAPEGTSAEKLRDYWVRDGRVAFDAASKAIAAVPIFEMNSPIMAIDIQRIQGAMTKMTLALERLQSQWESVKRADILEIFAEVRVQCDLVTEVYLEFELHYERAISKQS